MPAGGVAGPVGPVRPADVGADPRALQPPVHGGVGRGDGRGEYPRVLALTPLSVRFRVGSEGVGVCPEQAHRIPRYSVAELSLIGAPCCQPSAAMALQACG